MVDALDPIRQLRHDLSNPLAAILAETQLLLLSADKYDAETVTSLKQIAALSRKMRGIVEALDRWTRESAAPAGSRAFRTAVGPAAPPRAVVPVHSAAGAR